MPWQQIVKYTLIIVFIGGLWGLHQHDKNKAIEAVKIEMKAIAEADARAKEQVLTYDAYKLGRDKDEKIASVNTKLANALRLLSERTNRPTNPTTSSSGEACTGRELFRQDAEFLTREAARADALTAERDYYYERYENARRTLAGEKQDEGHNGSSSNTKPLP